MDNNRFQQIGPQGHAIRDILSFVYVLLILISFYPYEFYSAFPFIFASRQKIISFISLILTLVLTLLSKRAPLKMPSILLSVVIMQCFWLVINNFVKGREIGLGAFIVPLLALSLVYFLLSTCGLVEFFKKYNFWILLMTSMGSVALILVRAGLLSPLYSFVDLSDEEFMLNYGLTFSRDYGDFAYCGFFDEPGAIASWSLYALIFNKLFIKNDKIEIGLIVTTLLTFSMGYYAQLLVYFIVFHVFNKKSKTDSSNSIVFIFIVGLMIFIAINTQHTADSDIYNKTIGRMVTAWEDSKTQGLAIDDREDYTIDAIQAFKENPLFGATKDSEYFGNNIFEPLALYGVVGTFFLYFPFLVLIVRALRERNYDLLRCMIVIIAGFTHRPFHNYLLSYFIIYSFIALYYQQRVLNKELSV